jgi:hypothetical protein
MSSAPSPSDILEAAYQRATQHIDQSLLTEPEQIERINNVTRSNIGAGVRLSLACTLAKMHNPAVDIRRPFTNLGERSYSGRNYDEQYVTRFVNEYELPCNVTTAFLTPALRTKRDIALVPGTDLGGRDRNLYEQVILLLDDVENGRLSAEDLLTETVRSLVVLKRERQQRLSSLLSEVRRTGGEIPLSSEDIVSLIQQHLRLPRASRLPVLVVAAAYEAASENLGERVLPLESHTAADERTGALGDVEITLVGDDQVVTTYEMKFKRITKDDIDRALHKIKNSGARIDNYLFVTTDEIADDVADYARSLYRTTGGIEVAILDCIGFLRHFLHLFHRLRLTFLDVYQELLLKEPDSAVRESLKEAFLAMRRATESSYEDDASEC